MQLQNTKLKETQEKYQVEHASPFPIDQIPCHTNIYQASTFEEAKDIQVILPSLLALEGIHWQLAALVEAD